jgi:hypothetical protein
MRNFLSYAIDTITTIIPRYWQAGIPIAFNGAQMLTLKKIFDLTVRENITALVQSHWDTMRLAWVCGILGGLSAWVSMTEREAFAASGFIMSAMLKSVL